MLKNFDVDYLEEMLNSSTKSVAKEVVSTLVKAGNQGTLRVIEKRMNSEQLEDGGESPGEEDNFVSPTKQLEGFGHQVKQQKKSV